MIWTKAIGLLLVIFGVLGLVYGGVSYSRQRTIVDVGPIQATATEQKNIPLPPLAGGISLIAGIALLAIPTKRMS